MIKLKLQRATAIITAILIVSVVSIAAITMQGYLYGEMNRTQMIIGGDRMLNGLYSIESWGLAKIIQLNLSEEKKSERIKAGQSEVIERSISMRDNNLTLTGDIINQNGMFNVNYLYSESKCKSGTSSTKEQLIQQIFKNTIKIKTENVMSLTDSELDEIIANIQIFMCSNNDKKYDGVKDIPGNTEQPNQSWAYQNTGQLFVDTSELRLVPGFSNDIYKLLSSAITVFPVDMKNQQIQIVINVNDISVDLLAALAGSTIDEAETYISNNVGELKNQKKSKVSREIKELILKYIKDKNNYSEAEFDVLSAFLTTKNKNNFYRIAGKANLEGYVMQLNTLINYNKKINIVWRKRSITSG